MDTVVFEPASITPGETIVIRRCSADGIAVKRTSSDYRLVATRAFAVGEGMFVLEGRTMARPTRYSVQVGLGVHLDPGSWCTTGEIIEGYFWRFLNHSCNPNVRIEGREAKAARDIPAWVDLGFDYNTTELELAEAFDCHCGAANCLGRVRGFRSLSPVERERRRPLLAPYLRDFADPATAG